ncbi:MAG: hypothetical protein EXX96DRAFT_564536 [Benjaminiella poitrasii]|nr:MAG: hypothetical protein EXX96DRAFT_564536 [Benjaminiella poitrasii]
MNITREQAICMFFGQKFNQTNVSILSKRIDEFKDIDICYDNDPKTPILVLRRLIQTKPYKYIRYRSVSSSIRTLTHSSSKKINIKYE